MANLNRTEVTAFIESLAAIVDLEELKECLNDNFAQSAVFRKDVSSTDTASGSKTVNFLDIDFITITQTGNVIYELDNVQSGEIKYLKINKSSGDTIEFDGTTDLTPDPNSVTNQTSVYYLIFSKGGLNALAISHIVVNASTTVAGILETATSTEAEGFSSTNKILTPSNLVDIRADGAEITNWTEDKRFISPSTLSNIRATASQTEQGTEDERFVTPSTLQGIENYELGTIDASWSGNIRCAIDNVGNKHLQINVSSTSSFSSGLFTIGTLPDSKYRPSLAPLYIGIATYNATGPASTQHVLRVLNSSDTITILMDPNTYPGAGTISIYLVYR